MNGLKKAYGSSTAIVGVLSLLIYVGAARIGVTIPWELVASLIGGYAVKEGAKSFAAPSSSAPSPKPAGKK